MTKTFRTESDARKFAEANTIPGFWFVSNDNTAFVFFSTGLVPPAYRIATHPVAGRLQGKVVSTL